MDGIKDETAPRTKQLEALANLPANVVGRPKRQGALGIYSSTPESDSLTKLSLQLLGIHVGRRALHRVHDVESRGDEIFNQIEDRSAGVDESLPRGVLVHPVVNLLVEGKKQFTVSFRRHKRPVLRAEIGAGQVSCGGAVPTAW